MNTRRSSNGSAAGAALLMGRRGLLIAIGGTALLADAGGRLLVQAANAGTRRLAAWNAAAARTRSQLFGG